VVPCIVDGEQRPSDTKLDYRSCLSCGSAEWAGSSEQKPLVRQKDHLAYANIRRGGIAGMLSRDRPGDLRKTPGSQ
jgi:hypothetical protein